MRSFTWSEAFETGLDTVDDQHQTLVGLVNELGETISSGSPDGEEVDTILSQLVNYTQYHFSEEERLMARHNVDSRHRQMHMAEHTHFVGEVSLLRATRSSDPKAPEHLLDFLAHWLAYHILGSDQSMARQIHAIKSGVAPTDAYSQKERSHEGATEPLLEALNGLFSQVSARNRELVKLNQSLEAKVAERTAALSEANARLEEMTLTDALTQLPNRRAALRRFERLWLGSSESGEPLSCMMVDADGFKHVNDAHGHDAGDLVLQVLARELRQRAGTDDFVCRLGGDEFLILCADTSLEDAFARAERIQCAVEGLHVSTGDGDWAGSVSIGVATRQPSMDSYRELLKQADRSVYEAKRLGKNRVASLQRITAAPGVHPIRTA